MPYARPAPTAPRPLAALRGLTLLALVLAWAPAARAADTAARVTVPVGIPVTIDGYAQPAEWDDARTLPLAPGVTLRLKQHRGTALLAMEGAQAWPVGARLVLYLAPEDAPEGALSPGAVDVQFEPRAHDRPHVIAGRVVPQFDAVGRERIGDGIVFRHRLGASRFSIEAALRGEVLPQAETIVAAIAWVRPDDRDPPRWPATLDLAAEGPGLAPELKRIDGWGRLVGWRDLQAPAAFPKSRWATWKAEDDELTRRGDAAHSYVRLIVEEWRDTAKEDAEVQREVFDNLAWIAAREPLTAGDLLAKAKALRWLNRCDEALAIYGALRAGPDPSAARRALSESAYALQALERFDEAAAIWDAVAARPQPAAMQERFRALATRAREDVERIEVERAARRAALARDDVPLLGFETPHGTAIVALHTHVVPGPAGHLLELAVSGAYDGTLFHHVVGASKAHGGLLATREKGCEPAASERGDPPRTDGAANPAHGFWRGALVLEPAPGGGHGSEFSVLTSPRPDLDTDTHTVVGHVVAGQDVIDRLARCDPLVKVHVLRK